MTERIHVGGVAIGGGAPVSIQSMLNTEDDGRRPPAWPSSRRPGGGWVPDRPPGHPATRRRQLLSGTFATLRRCPW